MGRANVKLTTCFYCFIIKIIMRIMGIDPGLANLGWGVIEVFNNGKPVLVDYGCINTLKTKSIVNRLGSIYKEVSALIEKFSPDEIAMEEIFFASNTKTAIKVAHASGAVMIALSHADIEVSEYTPLQIKQALVGYGRAKKGQVQYMVKNFLNLKEVPKSDHASDALATALCHNSSRKLRNIVSGN